MTHIEQLVQKYPELVICVPALKRAFKVLQASFQGGGKLLVCGNGGSAADSEHIIGELMKSFLIPRPVPAAVRQKLEWAHPERGRYLADNLQGALPAISLVSQTSLTSACSNDVDADMVFAQQVYGYGVPGDVVLGISTSGTSRNVIHALQVGCALGLHTIGLTGQESQALAEVCEVVISVPWERVPDIQERHLPVYHTLCAMLEEAFFAS